ncbi:MAG: DUF4870 domain-containing protein [Planctomycetota bacterium]|nr:DUF4870 domain-containing protein [Planctomycetota bacterium]
MERIDEANQNSVALAHISGLAGYVIPFGGVIAPILMMMGAEDGSQEERAAKQALALNVFVFIMGILLVISALTIVLIPVAIVCGAVVGVLGFGLPIYGLVKALDGEFCRFPFVGAFAE